LSPNLIEYDDGKPADQKIKDRSPFCTPRGRTRGYYLLHGDNWIKLPLAHMHVGEIASLTKVLQLWKS
jgi:hypothetical protein